MLKLRGDALCKLLEIFNQALIFGSFPSDWKNANIVPIHKKGGKQTNYRQASFLPMCGQIFETLIFNEMFRFFVDNKRITTKQSGFKPGNACINQLLSVKYKSFDDGLKA